MEEPVNVYAENNLVMNIISLTTIPVAAYVIKMLTAMMVHHLIMQIVHVLNLYQFHQPAHQQTLHQFHHVHQTLSMMRKHANVSAILTIMT